MKVSAKDLYEKFTRAVKAIKQKEHELAALSKDVKQKRYLPKDATFDASSVETKCLHVYNELFKFITGKDPEQASRFEHFVCITLISFARLVASPNRLENTIEFITEKLEKISKGKRKDSTEDMKDILKSLAKEVATTTSTDLVDVITESTYLVISYICLVARFYYRVYEVEIKFIKIISRILIILGAIGLSLTRARRTWHYIEIAAMVVGMTAFSEIITRLLEKLFNSLRNGRLRTIRKFALLFYMIQLFSVVGSYAIAKMKS